MYDARIEDRSNQFEPGILQKLALGRKYEGFLKENNLFSKNLFVFPVNMSRVDAKITLIKAFKDKHHTVFEDNNRVFIIPDKNSNPGYLIDTSIRNRNHFVNVRSTIYFDDYQKDYKQVKNKIEATFKTHMVQGQFCSITWAIQNEKGGINYYFFNELLADEIHGEAYPHINDIGEFADNYFESSASVLFLLGPPGTGKTRFIRYIINRYARKNDIEPSVLYTSSRKPLELEEIFVSFLEDDYKFMVLEDADKSLESRKDGNREMSSILTAADGLIQNLNKKIIITCNLPNLSEVDQALLRPGRCYDTVSFPISLSREEYGALLSKISNGRYGKDVVPMPDQLENPKVADVYKQYHKLEKTELV